MELSVIESVTARRDYQQLVRARRRYSATPPGVIRATDSGFTVHVAVARPVPAAPRYRGATTTVGIAAGVAIILIAIGLTACYVLRANRAFDRRVDAILQRS